ncbi:uncharacterized protein PHACADRAFT_264511 [Phanerochaete carnosa HHB-10118-sp]|uniref:ATP-dependent DNA helicase n=1 Tax=Phanerochaete carnosa (strain HHB-10118-sp) TaxID=650164 RepID=K5WIG3_PHACS|nr:uncharacterized protein PHACADRAFT_264511 [Phanerochaete carnosa HHB-10118-sp]EKM50027.1 hypothetical protein PHACADRAFT_264511 [Phanerochaete carnosa HHB-10118-sp]
MQNPDDPYTVDTKPGSKPNSAAPAKDTKKSAAIAQKWPVVEFTNPKRRLLIQPEAWKVELPDGEVQISRTQVRLSWCLLWALLLHAHCIHTSQLPLILAWAMSIHKSQGQTLERVKVDLGRIFEKGMSPFR